MANSLDCSTALVGAMNCWRQKTTSSDMTISMTKLQKAGLHTGRASSMRFVRCLEVDDDDDNGGSIFFLVTTCGFFRTVFFFFDSAVEDCLEGGVESTVVAVVVGNNGPSSLPPLLPVRRCVVIVSCAFVRCALWLWSGILNLVSKSNGPSPKLFTLRREHRMYGKSGCESHPRSFSQTPWFFFLPSFLPSFPSLSILSVCCNANLELNSNTCILISIDTFIHTYSPLL